MKADITTTRTFLSTSADAQLVYTYLDDWNTAWDAYSATYVDNAGSILLGGQTRIDVGYGIEYDIGRSMFYFDSSDLPTGANITSAVLSLYIYTDGSDTDFNVTIQGTGTYPHIPAVASDYWRGWYSTTSLGSRSTSDGLSASAFWNITLNTAGIDLINDAGYTRLCVRSQEDIDGSEPTTNEYLWIGARDMGESYAPKLYVTYTVSEGGGAGIFNYYFSGPYEDDGNVLDGTVSVTLYPTANETIGFDLVGDGVNADTYSLNLEQQAVLMVWNVSSSGNYTRVLYFTDDNTETIYVAVPDQDLPFSLYSFTVNDFDAVTDGYLESLTWIGGATRVVERQPLNTINACPFYMGWSHAYSMRVVCDEGTLDLGTFTALTTTDQTVLIPYGAFPDESLGLTMTVNADRYNATAIEASYVDPEDATAWLYIDIKHRESLSGDWVTAYSANTTAAYSYSLLWAQGNNQTDYLVTIQVYREGVKSWVFSCPYERGTPNIWAPLANLGNFGGTSLSLEYVPAILLIVGSLLAFSYYYLVAGVWIAWGVACFCSYVGWLPYDATVTPVVLGVAAVINAGITIGEFKRTERDL